VGLVGRKKANASEINAWMLPKNNKSSEIFVHIFLSFLCSLLQASKSYISTSRLKKHLYHKNRTASICKFWSLKENSFFPKIENGKREQSFFLCLYLSSVHICHLLSVYERHRRIQHFYSSRRVAKTLAIFRKLFSLHQFLAIGFWFFLLVLEEFLYL